MIVPLSSLIRDPRERLSVEIKRWLDPSTPECIAKIAKACIALRNHGGGYLLFGFADDGTPDLTNVPRNVRASFHWDVIQRIVGKYSSEAFEVAVDFVERDGVEYPVISVPAGVRCPVAAKADLFNARGTVLLKSDTVYVRTLLANNTASSAVARAKDWEQLVRCCCANRNAEFGTLLRQQLCGLSLVVNLVPPEVSASVEEFVADIDLVTAFHAQPRFLPDPLYESLDSTVAAYARAHGRKDIPAAGLALKAGAASIRDALNGESIDDRPFRDALYQQASLMADMARCAENDCGQEFFWTLANHYVVIVHDLLAAHEPECV